MYSPAPRARGLVYRVLLTIMTFLDRAGSFLWMFVIPAFLIVVAFRLIVG